MELQRCIGHRPMVRPSTGRARVVAGCCRGPLATAPPAAQGVAHDADRRGPARPGGHGRADRGRRDRARPRTRSRAFVHEQLAAHGRSTGAASACWCPTRPGPARCRCCCGAVHGALHGRVSRLTVLVALGTHAPMGEEALAAHLGYAPGRLAETYPGTTVVNHEWWKPETFADLGTVPAARIVELSEGRMDLEVPVLLNRAVVEHDVALVLGPVLPARGGRDLRRQQVLLPRRRRPEDHRRVALAGCADHLGGDHRHHRHHPGAGADRRRRRR